jgi:proline iminopeptidase
MLGLEEHVIADDGVKLRTVRSRTVITRRTPLVLCHGGPGLWDDLAPVGLMLHDLLGIVRWDQRGAGRSDPVGPYSVARCIADMECIRESLGIERWVVGGHSWGAGLALRYALEHPSRVRGLICISGTDLGWKRHREAYRAERLRRLGPHLERWSELRGREALGDDERRELNRLNFMTDFADRAEAPELAKRWGYERFAVNLEANAAINADVDAEDEEQLRTRCASLTAQAILVHGDQDPRPLDGPRELAAVLPNARLAVLPGVGHIPWAEHPDLLRDELRAFLKSLSDST